PTQRISRRNSTGNASWGGPQHREIGPQLQQAMQVGVAPTQKLTESQLTIMCEMGIHNKSLVSFYHFRFTA
ncbi:hypothetical protein LHK32_08330, partial [Staphylococcus argenteus]|nr:hypothetical protein [Staphylococcus argenteus]